MVTDKGFMTNFLPIFQSYEEPQMHWRKWDRASFFLLLLCLLAACTTSKVELQDRDRIVFLGDSITELGDQPGGYVSLVRDTLISRYPDLGLEVLGAGVSGNKVPDLQARLSEDVLAKHPTVVVVYIGINDVWHSTMAWGGTPIPRYAEGLRSVLSRITNTGARVVLCTPTVIGERHDGANPLDGMLDEYADISRQVARELKVPLLDLRKVFLRYLRIHNPDNAGEGILTSDGVHLSDKGNQLVAGEILRVFGEKGLD